MKKIFLSVLILASLGSMTVSAKKDKKKKNQVVNLLNPVSITTANDSLLYAYGVTLTEQGLRQYLQQMNVIADTATVNANYNERINNATTTQEKELLAKELKHKQDSISVSNAKNIDLLLKGIKERFGAKNEEMAYTKGLEIGGQLNGMVENEQFKKMMGYDASEAINHQTILMGLTDAIKKESLLIPNSEEIVKSKMDAYQQQEVAKKEEANAEAIEKGNRFLAENASKAGIVTLPSGLQYKVITEGKGAKPTAQDRVKVHYHGTLIDGTTFDSSVDRGEPITFGVSQVIPGWTEALQLMPVGSKWMLYIPYNLGYGDRDAGSIPPYSVLIFEVELLEIEK